MPITFRFLVGGSGLQEMGSCVESQKQTDTRAKQDLTFAGWPKPSILQLRICHPCTPKTTKLLPNATTSPSCTQNAHSCRLHSIGRPQSVEVRSWRNIQSALAVLGLPKRPSLPSSRKNPLPDRVKPFFMPFLTIVRSAMTATIRIAKVAKG